MRPIDQMTSLQVLLIFAAITLVLLLGASGQFM